MSQQIDPRGQQLAAAITSVVLAAALVSGPGPVAVAVGSPGTELEFAL